MNNFTSKLLSFLFIVLITFSTQKLSAQAVSVNATALTGGLATSPLVGGNTGKAIFGFKLNKAAGGANSITSIAISLDQDPTTRIQNAFLYYSIDGTFDGTDVQISTGTATTAPDRITFTTFSSNADFGGVTTATSSNYFLVVNIFAGVASSPPSITASLPATGVGATTGSPTGSVSGTAYTFAALNATITGLNSVATNKVAASPLSAGATAQGVFGFSLQSNGVQTVSQINIQLSADPASVLGTFSLISSTDADYSTPGDNTPVATSAFTVTTSEVQITPSTAINISSVQNFFLVASVDPGVTGATAPIQASLAPANITLNIPGKTGSATGINYNFQLSQAAIGSLNVVATNGVANTPLSAGTNGAAVFGFSLLSSGAQTVSIINVQVSSDPTGKLSGFTLVNSGDADFGSTGDNATVPAAFVVTSSQIGITPSTALDISTLHNLFLVANVNNMVTTSTPTIKATLTAGDIVTAGGKSGSSTGLVYGFTPSKASDINLAGGTTASIAYGSYQAASPLTSGGSPNSASLGLFEIRDGGASHNDLDGLPTVMTNLNFNLTNFANVLKIAIFDEVTDTNLAEQTVASGTVAFSGLTLTAPDGGDKQFRIRATFKSTVTDKNQVNISISSAVAANTGSDFLSTVATTTTNEIAVVATKLAFTVAGPIVTAPATEFAPLNVEAVDVLGNRDLDAIGTVTLTAPGATLTALPTGTPALALGFLNYTSLKLSPAGTFTLTAAATGLANGTITIDVQSLGVTITPSSTPSLCYSGLPQTLGDIIVTESDKADFGVGTGVSISLLLPTGFVFDTSLNPLPILSATADISAPVAANYVGNDIVRIGYTVTNILTNDVITITGLKVRYIGTVPTSANITRVGGNAVQKGNADTDNKNHGTLVASPSATTTTITVQELPGNPSVNPAQTSFSAGAQPVKLIATTPGTGGVFSGNGVSLSATNGYIFTPSAVGSGSSTITYTATETSGQFCSYKGITSFNVTSGVVTGLASKYCTTQTSPVPISISSPQLNSDWGALYHFSNFVYFDWTSVSWQTLASLNGNVFVPSDYVGIAQGYVNYYLTFYGINVPPGVYIGYQVRDNATNTLQTPVRNYDFVSMIAAPNVTFSPPTTVLCVDASPLVLSPTAFTSPTPSNTVGNDYFTATLNGAPAVTNTGGNVWVLDPGNVTNAATSTQTFALSYTYKDPSTGCSNTSSPVSMTVNPKPPAIIPSNITPFNGALTPKNNLFTCVSNAPGSFTAATIIGTTYKWYADAALTAVSGTTNTFSPSVNVASPGTTSFYATRTISGCESVSLQVNVVVKQNAIVDAGGGAAANICSGGFVDLLSLTPSITGSITTGTWSMVSGTTGTFLDAADVLIAGPVTLAVARKFVPTVGQANARLRLTADLPSTIDPNNPCVPLTDDVIITINPGATSNAGITQNICAGGAITLTGTVGGAAVSGLWTQLPSTTGALSFPSSLTTNYTPLASELTNGANLTFQLTSNDPPGPCAAAFSTVNVNIFKQATVNAGIDQNVCARPSSLPVVLSGTIGGSTSSATWSSAPVGGTFSPSPTTLGASYIPTATQIANGANLIFTLLSDDPAGPCPAVSSTMKLSLKPIPGAPTVAQPSDYCAGQVLKDLIASNSLGGNITWFSDAGLTTTVGTNSVLTPSFISNTNAVTTQLFVTETASGCQGPVTNVQIVIHPLPVANFSAVKYCLGDFMEFTDLSTIPAGPAGPYTKTNWYWKFNDADELNGAGPIPPATHAGRTTATFDNPKHKYGAINAYNISLIVTSNKGCVSNDIQKVYNVGPVPQTDFTIQNECTGDVTQFVAQAGAAFDNTTLPRTITNWTWGFGDPASGPSNSFVSTTTNLTSHAFTGVSTYSITLTQTSGLGCISTTVKPVSILPYITSFSTPHAAHFDGGTDGWVGVGTNSDGTPVWKQGTPAGTTINSTASGSGAWYVTKPSVSTTYDANLRAVLNGPCINVTQLPLPVLSFKYYNNTDDGSDGAYLETSSDGGLTWVRLGLQNSGINWYNKTSISGLQVGSGQYAGIGQLLTQAGWTGTSNGWIEGRVALDPFITQTKLRVRFVFGTDATTPLDPVAGKLDGFAIDEFALDSRNRIMLVETITNENAPNYAANNNNFKSAAFSTEVAKIQYHTSFPKDDSQSGKNQTDNNARAAFYGVNSSPGSSGLIPKGYVDGFSEPAALGAGNFALANGNTWWELLKTTRVLAVSPLKLTISNPVAPSSKQMSVGVKITVLKDIPSRNLIAVIGIVEKTVGANTYVIRKLIPDNAGVKIQTPVTAGTVIDLPIQTTDLNGVTDLSQLAIVAFVQDINTTSFPNPSSASSPYDVKEVLQAAILNNPPNLPLLITDVPQTFAASLEFYPVPANREITVRLMTPAESENAITVVDMVGKPVIQSSISKGEQTKTLSTVDLPSGMYIIQVGSGTNAYHKKVMVVH